MIDRMLAVTDRGDFATAVRALDRLLVAERAVIPFGFADRARIAHRADLRFPADRLPLYGDFLGFLPELWWIEAP
jgi:peptide/nickel transport system substrate-binding protein